MVGGCNICHMKRCTIRKAVVHMGRRVPKSSNKVDHETMPWRLMESMLCSLVARYAADAGLM